MAEKMVKIYRNIQNKKRVSEERARKRKKGTQGIKTKKETLELRMEKKDSSRSKGRRGSRWGFEEGAGSAVQESRVRRSRRRGGWGKKVKKLGHDDRRRARKVKKRVRERKKK